MSASHINDTLAQSWADALRANERLTSLSLESNAIGSAGILALAHALPSSHLTELKLANQCAVCSQAAEEAFAEALGRAPMVTRLTLEPALTPLLLSTQSAAHRHLLFTGHPPDARHALDART